MLLKGAYCVGEHFVDPQRIKNNMIFDFVDTCGIMIICCVSYIFEGNMYML